LRRGALFNLFIILILDVSLLDPVILAGLNILSVIFGVLVFEKVKEKNYVKNIS
jgi:hypothetical protein